MKLKSGFLLVLFTVFMGYSALAQNITIQPDRPDQTDGTYTIPVHNFQLEEGVTFSENSTMNNFMLRYGLFHATEVRLSLDAGKTFGRRGLQPIDLSVKQRIVQQNSLLPAIAVLGNLSYNQWASKDFRTNQISYGVKLAFENTISDQWSIGYNIGTAEAFNTLDVTFEIGYSPIQHLATFLEYFSTFSDGSPQHNIDLGAMYLLQKNIQIDFALGRSIFAAHQRLFATCGISYWFVNIN
ncbi:MAG TPA: transporter [Chitinophagaceae bacterium]|nr:transporter [Chitinophagaceae bacterium]